jgi:uncharacterized protein involved in exopolysaccharide biosynthesis
MVDGPRILGIAWRGKWILMLSTLIGAVLTWVVCLMVPPLYESEVVMLPGNTASRDKQLQEFRFGYDADSERLIQLLESEALLDSLNEAFALAQDWEIDVNRPDWRDKLLHKAKSRIKAQKTRYASVVVSVRDEDPHEAAQKANALFGFLNAMNANIVKENAKQVLRSLEQEFEEGVSGLSKLDDSISSIQGLNAELAIGKLEVERSQILNRGGILRDSLQKIRSRLQMYDYGHQVSLLNEQLAEARATLLQESGSLEVLEKTYPSTDSHLVKTKARLQGAQKRVDYFDQQLKGLNQVNGRFLYLEDEIEQNKKSLSDIEMDLNKLKQSVEPKVNSRELSGMEMAYEFDRIRLDEIRQKYRMAMSNLLYPLPIAHLVSPAHPSFIPVFPRKGLTSVMAAAACFVLTLLLLALQEARISKRPNDAEG